MATACRRRVHSFPKLLRWHLRVWIFCIFMVFMLGLIKTFQDLMINRTSENPSLVELTFEETSMVRQQIVVGSPERIIDQPSKAAQNMSLSLLSDNVLVSDIWKQPNNEGYIKCINRTKKEKSIWTGAGIATDGYILANANGGLNQMKLGISDMVAVAKLMNGTLILPSLDHKSYWNDISGFKDIFDWKNFVEVLKEDVRIEETLPLEFKSISPYRVDPISWSKLSYYKDSMRKKLKNYKVIEFKHTDSRMDNNVSGAMQRLRCRAMYEALRFRKEIEQLGKRLVNRMRNNSADRFIALHLRYEKDMLAFTGCSHNLSKTEHEELTQMRYKTPHWKQKNINPRERRLQGNCPMTPREVAVFLQALGYPSETKIYVVGGKIYGQHGMSSLEEKYPNLYSKQTLATEKELKLFHGSQNQLAAIDYVVALESDVFVYSYDGNMARALQGHRKFEGFRKTISPDRQNFVKLIDEMDKDLITWESFSSSIKSLHVNRTGAPIPRDIKGGRSQKLEENFYSNPLPGCICTKKKSKLYKQSTQNNL